MNCRNCNSNIDYNYVSNCPECGGELEKDELPKLDPSMMTAEKRRKWTYRSTNLLYTLSLAFAGMFAGAMVTYVSFGAIYLAVRSPEPTPGAHCGEGMALGFLSLFAGAFLGTVAGAVLAVRRPVFKTDS